MQKILLKHLKGPKAGSADQFPVSDSLLIVIGTAQECQVRFETSEASVKPRHVTIEIKSGPSGNEFILTNADSACTTLVNKRLMFDSAKLSPTDVIQIGRGGPELEFDLDPRKVDRGGRRPALEQDEGAKEKNYAKPILLSLLTALGIVLLLALFAGAYIFISRWRARAAEQPLVGQPVAAAEGTIAQFPLPPPAQQQEEPITQDYGHTVYAQASWHLRYGKSAQPVFHKHVDVGGAKLPVFVRMPDASVEPWLLFDDEQGLNPALGRVSSAFAFLVDDRGFFLTTRNIAAPHLASYNFDLSLGVRLYSSQCLKPASCPSKDIAAQQLAGTTAKTLGRWTPSGAKFLTRSFGPETVPISRGDFSVSFDEINVRSSGSTYKYPATVVASSDRSDVGVLKVENMPLPAKVNVHSARVPVKPGDDIAVIGYSMATSSELERFATGESDSDSPAPQPKASLGKIGPIIRTNMPGLEPGQQRQIYVLDMYSKMELIPGSPVLISNGEAIGVLTLSPTSTDRNMLAIPISYGLELIPAGDL